MIFRYESIGKLASTLHASIAFGVALQIAAVAVPGLRSFLAIAPLNATDAAIVTAAVIATWAAAALVQRITRLGGPSRATGGTARAELGNKQGSGETEACALQRSTTERAATYAPSAQLPR